MDERRGALVDAMAGEHRLRRQAVREAQEAQLWLRRESLAESHGLAEMAEAAHTRVEGHRRMERLLLARADDIRAEIDRMRAADSAPAGLGRAPPSAVPLESRMARLEIEHEIQAIRATISARSSSTRNHEAPSD